MGKKRKRSTKQSPVVDAMVWAETYLSENEISLLKRSLQINTPVSIRINCLKSDPATFSKQLSTRYGWEMEPIPFCGSGFWINNPAITPSSTIEHRMGYYYIQEAASMLPSELFDLTEQQNPLILDMAASPGGKTIHLIDRTQDKGLVIANDASRSRIPALRVVLDNWGAVNQAISNLQGEWFGWAMPETFDAVLLDAPCSMQGLRTSASHKSRPITESEIETLAVRQVNLLSSALHTIKTGGEVVYSTCTLSPAENEAVLAQVVDKYGESIEIFNIQEGLLKPAPALTEIAGKKLPEEVQRAARLWPHIYGTAGFFSAKILKKKSLSNDGRNGRDLPSIAKHGQTLANVEQEKIIGKIAAQFSFDLEGICNEQDLEVREIKGDLYLVASRFDALENKFPIQFMGIALGKQLPGGWQPSHTFISRFGDQFRRNVFILEEEYLSNWVRGEDIKGITDTGIAIGSIVVVRDADGRNMGRGKVLKDRLKNQLPTRLF